MSDFLFFQEGVILDACCIINLYASGYMQSILESIPKQVAVASYVRDVEASKIYNGPAEDVTKEIELINLQPFIDNNLLVVVSPDNEMEKNTVVNLSSVAALDSGEAITSALAIHRQWSLGTDDRATISFFRQKMPCLHLISTLDMLKHWVEVLHPPPTVVSASLKNIQNRARYRPHYNHSLYKWWVQNY